MGVTTMSRLNRWEQATDSAVRFVPYVALAVSVVLAWAASPFIPSAPLPGTLLVAGVAAGWMLWMVTLHPAWQDRRLVMAGYYIVLIGLIALLIARNPLFGFLASTGYLHAVYAAAFERGLLTTGTRNA
jgi:hypothetical protein